MSTKPSPLFPEPLRAVCPHCGKTSYSVAGVHPQCAMNAADRVRMDQIKRLAPKPVAPPATLRSHEKRCPRCAAVQHLRKSRCVCGQVFFATSSRACGE